MCNFRWNYTEKKLTWTGFYVIVIYAIETMSHRLTRAPMIFLHEVTPVNGKV